MVFSIEIAFTTVTLTILRGTEIKEVNVNTGDRYENFQLKPKKPI